MNCESVEEKLIDLMLGFLPEDIDMDTRSHLLVCDKCTGKYERYKLVQKGCEELPEVEPSEALKMRILRRFRTERKKSYSERLKKIAENRSFFYYFMQWIRLQLHRPAAQVAFVAAAILLSVVVSLNKIWHIKSDHVIPVADISKLPETGDSEMIGWRRESETSKRARLEFEKQLAELEELDIPEQTWRIVEIDEEAFEIKPISPKPEESEVVVAYAKPQITYTPEGIDKVSKRVILSLYKNRYDKTKALAYYDGQDIREVIESGLKWLSLNQSSDGSWGGDRARVFTTSLAGLCFLADIDIVSIMGYEDTLDRTFDFIISKRTSPESFFGGNDQNSRRAHITALNFLIEYASLTNRHEVLDDMIIKGLKYTYTMGSVKGWEVIESQFNADRSVIGWYIILLETAREAGFRIDRLFFDRAKSWITQATYGGKEGVAETTGFIEDDITKAAIAFMGRYFLKEKLHKKDIEDIAWKLLVFIDENRETSGNDMNPFYLYFSSLGLFQNHGKEWYLFHRKVKNLLASTAWKAEDHGQDRGMYWTSKERRYAGHGNAFYTAMSVLTLQTYYRYTVFR